MTVKVVKVEIEGELHILTPNEWSRMKLGLKILKIPYKIVEVTE